MSSWVSLQNDFSKSWLKGHYKHKFPIYPFSLDVVLIDVTEDTEYCFTHEDYGENFSYDSETHGSAQCTTFPSTDGTPNVLLVINLNGLRNDHLVHETFHILFAFCRTSGLRINSKDQEACAYLLGYIFRVIEELLNEVKAE